MYEIFRTSSFKKDYKKLSTTDKEILKEVVISLANGETLAEEYKDHKLIGNSIGIHKLELMKAKNNTPI